MTVEAQHMEPRSPISEGTKPEAAESSAARPEAMKKCRCGHDKSHHMVSPSGEYSFLGWVAILLGISAEPKSIKFQCRQCDTIIERSKDPAVISQTRLWG